MVWGGSHAVSLCGTPARRDRSQPGDPRRPRRNPHLSRPLRTTDIGHASRQTDSSTRLKERRWGGERDCGNSAPHWAPETEENPRRGRTRTLGSTFQTRTQADAPACGFTEACFRQDGEWNQGTTEWTEDPGRKTRRGTDVQPWHGDSGPPGWGGTRLAHGGPHLQACHPARSTAHHQLTPYPGLGGSSPLGRAAQTRVPPSSQHHTSGKT